MGISFENLDEKYIKSFSGSTIYQRGYDYYKKGYVKKLEYSSDNKTISAKVLGNYSNSYEVEIYELKNEIEAECTCPYDGYPCKHVVAVLLEFCNNKNTYIKNELKKIKKEEKSYKSIMKLISDLSKDELQKIIINLSNKNKEVRKQLLILLDGSSVVLLDSLKLEIDKIFKNKYHEYEDYYDEYYIEKYIRNLEKNLNKFYKDTNNIDDNLKIQLSFYILEELNELYKYDEYNLDYCDTLINDLLNYSLNKEISNDKEKQKFLREIIKSFKFNIESIISDVKKYLNKKDFIFLIDILKELYKTENSISYKKDIICEIEYLSDEINLDISDEIIKMRKENLYDGEDYYNLLNLILPKNEQKALKTAINSLGILKLDKKYFIYYFLCDFYFSKKDYKLTLDYFSKMLNEYFLENENIQFYPKNRTTPITDIYTKLISAFKNDYENSKILLEIRLKYEPNFELYIEAKKILNNNDLEDFENKLINELNKNKNKHVYFFDKYMYFNNLLKIYEYNKEYKKILDNILNLKNEQIILSYLEKHQNILINLDVNLYLERYINKIESLISLKTRENYKEATKYMTKLKKIYIDLLNNKEDFENYIKNILKKYDNLRALKDEIKKAKLI